MANAGNENFPSKEDETLESNLENIEFVNQADEIKEEEEIPTLSISELELERMRYESQDYKNKYFHALAESENARKRLMKEKQEMIQYSIQNIICDFLVPIDQMENALKYADKISEEVKQWSIGFQMVLTHFKDVLSNNNVESFESVGKVFDPHFHEAVEMIETNEYPPGVIVEECLKGYKIGNRVIRPARVKVAKELQNV